MPHLLHDGSIPAAFQGQYLLRVGGQPAARWGRAYLLHDGRPLRLHARGRAMHIGVGWPRVLLRPSRPGWGSRRGGVVAGRGRSVGLAHTTQCACVVAAAFTIILEEEGHTSRYLGRGPGWWVDGDLLLLQGCVLFREIKVLQSKRREYVFLRTKYSWGTRSDTDWLKLSIIYSLVLIHTDMQASAVKNLGRAYRDGGGLEVDGLLEGTCTFEEGYEINQMHSMLS
eukprot:1157334-Pelagomonas_calceolata.AAC.5